jgi:hypothetical protein
MYKPTNRKFGANPIDEIKHLLLSEFNFVDIVLPFKFKVKYSSKSIKALEKLIFIVNFHRIGS